jgi:hypothetical protein
VDRRFPYPVTLFGQRWHRTTSPSERPFYEWLAGSVAVLPMLSFRLTEVFDGPGLTLMLEGAIDETCG